MGKQRELKERLATLDEIEGIMSAMKNMALLEIRKLEVFLDTQHRAVASIEAAAQDFLSFYPQLQSIPDGFQQLWIVIGSERGFCGDFNELLLQFLNTNSQQSDTRLIVIGRKLEAKLHDDKRVAAFIEGHSVVEEIQGTQLHLTEVLNQLQQRLELAKIGRISAIYNDHDMDTVQLHQLFPLATPKAKPTRLVFPHAPMLNLEPTQFLAQLTDQYLYAALHEMFYVSLMMENHKRLEHMNNAINRLEKDEAELRLRYNKLRQEEIIEEIEIILLSAEALTEIKDFW